MSEKKVSNKHEKQEQEYYKASKQIFLNSDMQELKPDAVRGCELIGIKPELLL